MSALSDIDVVRSICSETSEFLSRLDTSEADLLARQMTNTGALAAAIVHDLEADRYRLHEALRRVLIQVHSDQKNGLVSTVSMRCFADAKKALEECGGEREAT